MVTQKRRIVYLSDEQWASAKAAGPTASAYIARLIDLDDPEQDKRISKALAFRGPILREEVDDLYGGIAPAGRTVLEPGGFNTRPFTPVPKTKPKR